jgi:hypothetical protein
MHFGHTPASLPFSKHCPPLTGQALVVMHTLREAGAGGLNPLTPTTIFKTGLITYNTSCEVSNFCR